MSDAFNAELASDTNRPVELYQVYLYEMTLYLAAHDKDVSFFSETGTPAVYHALGLSRTPIRTNLDTKVDECRVQLDNVSLGMSAYVQDTTFAKRRIKIIKVFLDELADEDDHAVMFDGVMDEPTVSEESVSIRVTSKLDVLDVELPRRRYSRLCQWRFGSSECGVSLASVTYTGTIDSISGDNKEFTLSGILERSGFFVDGVLLVGSEYSKVIESDGSSVTVEYPIWDVEVGDECTLRRGCDRTYDNSCEGRYSNGGNYGGFLSIALNSSRFGD